MGILIFDLARTLKYEATISTAIPVNPAENADRKRSVISPVRTIARPDEWAISMGLRVDGRPFSVEGGEFVTQVIRDNSPEIAVKKAAQMRFTITAITKAIHNILIRQLNGLYLLPLKTGAIPFVQARIDPTIDSNEFLRNEFKTVDNRLHKQSRAGLNLYVRGTNIERELQEIPVDFEIWDERDRMVEDNLEDARHRMDGSKWQKLMVLSTPTVPGHGVDAEDAWHASDQHLWEVPCPHCNRYQYFNFEENVKLGKSHFDTVFECQFCHKRITDEERWQLNARGRWVPQFLDGSIRGYHINQFNSPTMPLVEIVKGFFKGQTNIKKLKSFFNQNLGEPFASPGDKFTAELLDQCRAPYMLGGIPDGPVFVGVDVGTFLHVTARVKVYGSNVHRLWRQEILREWDELDKFLSGLTSFVAVIDMHPEKRAARDLALKYHGKVWLGAEMDRINTGEIAAWQKLTVNEPGRVLIDRTMAFDQVMADAMNGDFVIPQDARELGEHLNRRDYNGYYYQMIQQARMEEETPSGREVARWKKNKNADHWHHSEMFARMAMFQAPSLVIPRGLSEAFNRAGSLIRG